MATTESRTGFRLPWSADRAASRDDADGSDLWQPDPGDTEPAEADGEAPEPTAGPEATSPAASPAASTPSQAPGPTRRPAKFLVDMTHAMQAAAEQARAATLEQFRVEGASYVEQVQARAVAETDALRRRAEADLASIKEWSKAEITRIREETETRTTGRREQLEGQLARHAALVERDVARIEGQIASFETVMATFFDELLAETDLTVLAAHAQQMPEPPAFDPLEDSAFADLMNEPSVGIPSAVPAGVVPPVVVEAREEQATARVDAPSTGDASAEDADQPATPADMAPHDGPAGETPAGDTPAGDTPAADPRLAMLGLTPDYAAAEEEAAQAAAAEVSGIPEMGEDDLVARLGGLVGSSPHGAPADANPSAGTISTRVVVTGLVSVASIAGFKRHLSRCAGVNHVGVSSGPDGEFVFVVQHDAETSLRDLVPTLPGFNARVTGTSEGTITASARDPEA
jgi:hypothetical protein